MVVFIASSVEVSNYSASWVFISKMVMYIESFEYPSLNSNASSKTRVLQKEKNILLQPRKFRLQTTAYKISSFANNVYEIFKIIKPTTCTYKEYTHIVYTATCFGN